MPSQSFSHTGAYQEWTVPAGVTSIDVDLYGAQGKDRSTGVGGRGARMQATVAVPPGEVLRVYVGGQGGGGANTSAGFNGGGEGGTSSGQGGGGGSGHEHGDAAPQGACHGGVLLQLCESVAAGPLTGRGGGDRSLGEVGVPESDRAHASPR